MSAPVTILTTILFALDAMIRRLAVRRQLEHSLGQVLARADDNLLDDIGMTRHGAMQLIANPPVADPARAGLRFRTFTLASATGAGFFR